MRAFAAPFSPGDLSVASGLVWVTSLCGAPNCDISRASVRAFDEETGRLVAGPFRVGCGPKREGVFLSGIGATGGGAAVVRGLSRAPGLGLVILTAGRGAVRCVPL
jgi:hypothetical protein